MSVRRLADESVQPHDFAFTPDNDAWFEGELKKYPPGRQRSAIIPALMRAQEQEGWVSKRAIEHIADRLEMPHIRALEVATFYTQFMLSPVGTRAHVQVCGTTPCMLRGSEELFAVCKSRIGPRPFAPNAEGTLSWEEVECQGACVNAPMVMIGKDTFEDLTPERFEEIIDAFDAGEGADVPVGPQVDRHLSAPVGGRTTLLDRDEIDEHAHDEAPLDDRAETGEEDVVVPSEAARPDTHSQLTDPAYADPAPNAPNVDPAAEDAASADPDPRESGVGASAEGSAGQGDLSDTGFGDTPDDLHPDLAQHAPADPRRAGEANRAVAEAQAARDPRGAAVGGVQKEYAVETVHRDDERIHVDERDTGIEDAARRAAPAPTMAGTEADVEQVQAQRNARNAIGSDGVAAGDGAANDPKAIYGKQIPGVGTVDDPAKGSGTGEGPDGGRGDDAVAGIGPGPDGPGTGGAPASGAAPAAGEGGAGGQARPVDDGAVTTPGGVASAPPRDPRAAPDQDGSALSGGRADDDAGRAAGGAPGMDPAAGVSAAGLPEPVRAAATAPGGAPTLADDPEAPAPPSAHEEEPEAEPERLEAPREGAPDDLRLIWGVGPKLESMLHEMGFYHYDQIAGWTEPETQLGRSKAHRLPRPRPTRQVDRAGDPAGERVEAGAGARGIAARVRKRREEGMGRHGAGEHPLLPRGRRRPEGSDDGTPPATALVTSWPHARAVPSPTPPSRRVPSSELRSPSPPRGEGSVPSPPSQAGQRHHAPCIARANALDAPHETPQRHERTHHGRFP